MKTIGENPMQSKKRLSSNKTLLSILFGFCFFNLLNFYFFGTAFEEKKKNLIHAGKHTPIFSLVFTI